MPETKPSRDRMVDFYFSDKELETIVLDLYPGPITEKQHGILEDEDGSKNYFFLGPNMGLLDDLLRDNQKDFLGYANYAIRDSSTGKILEILHHGRIIRDQNAIHAAIRCTLLSERPTN